MVLRIKEINEKTLRLERTKITYYNQTDTWEEEYDGTIKPDKRWRKPKQSIMNYTALLSISTIAIIIIGIIMLKRNI